MVAGIPLEQIFDGRDAEGGAGREIDEVPLCAKCIEDVGRDRRAGGARLMPLALERVERFDGGLSRRRWEARQQREPSVVSGTSRPPQQDSGNPRRTPSPIYVSARDPLGEPSFKRSSTKPIPKWMRYLPNQVQATRDSLEPRPASMLDFYFTATGSGAADSNSEADESLPPPPPPVPAHAVPVRQIPPTHAPFQMSRPFTFVTEEPVQRSSSSKVANKHVHFTPSTPSSQQSTASNDIDKIPSESSEFLDRYHLRTPAVGSDIGSSTRTMSSCYDDRHARTVSPFFERFDTNLASSPVENVLLPGVDVKDEGESSCRAEQRPPRHVRSALELASRYGVAEYRKDGESAEAECQSTHHVASHSPFGHLHGGGDVVLDHVGAGLDAITKQRSLTFQDQLKGVFGFS